MNKYLSSKCWLLVAAMTLTACGTDSKLSRLTDYDLAERHAYCLDKAPTAPGKATACNNIKRECESRKVELGTYICRHH